MQLRERHNHEGFHAMTAHRVKGGCILTWALDPDFDQLKPHLGGSLSQSRYLNRWLSVLAAAGGAVAIVPGGGPFADQVRTLQKRRRFDDATAHHMALLAMEQYGRMLAGLSPGLRPAASRAEIARARRAGLTAVWMPTRMVLADPRIAASWDITSDSLAAWLAGKLKGDGAEFKSDVGVAEPGSKAGELNAPLSPTVAIFSCRRLQSTTRYTWGRRRSCGRGRRRVGCWRRTYRVGTPTCRVVREYLEQCMT